MAYQHGLLVKNERFREGSGFCVGQAWLTETLQSGRGLAEGVMVWSMKL